jgi:hypothetical protein
MQRRAFFKALCAAIGATLIEPDRVLAAPRDVDGDDDYPTEGEWFDPRDDIVENAIDVTWTHFPRGASPLGIVIQLQPHTTYTLRFHPKDKVSHLVGIRAFHYPDEITVLEVGDTPHRARGRLTTDGFDIAFLNSDAGAVSMSAWARPGDPMVMVIHVVSDTTVHLNMVVLTDDVDDRMVTPFDDFEGAEEMLGASIFDTFDGCEPLWRSLRDAQEAFHSSLQIE